MAEFNDPLELPCFWDIETAIVCKFVDLRKVHVLLIDDYHPAGGFPTFFPDETLQIRHKVVECEEVRRPAINDVVLFAIDMLQ